MKRPTFIEHVVARAEQGARDYGDESFERPVTDLLVELTEELADVAGWAYIAQAAAERRGYTRETAPELYALLSQASAEAWELHDAVQKLRVAFDTLSPQPHPSNSPGRRSLPDFLTEVAATADRRAPACKNCERC